LRILVGMCMQCVAGAMTAGATATGLRGWIVARAGPWLTPRRKAWMTRALIAGGVVAAGLIGPTPA
jgi:hypothetical protein